jgi:hypothetical protein
VKLTAAQRQHLRHRYSEHRRQEENAKDARREQAEKHAHAGKVPFRTPLWTEERIVHAIQQWTFKHGRPPGAMDWRYATKEYPSFTTVQNRYGSWNRGIEAAGLVPRATGVKRERLAA